MNKKEKILISGLILLSLFSCYPTKYIINYGQTSITLSNANFNNLGTYTGSAIKDVKRTNIKNEKGVIAEAKKQLLINASQQGVDLNNTRILTNISIDVVRHSKKISVTMCGEILEFIN